MWDIVEFIQTWMQLKNSDVSCHPKHFIYSMWAKRKEKKPLTLFFGLINGPPLLSSAEYFYVMLDSHTLTGSLQAVHFPRVYNIWSFLTKAPDQRHVGFGSMLAFHLWERAHRRGLNIGPVCSRWARQAGLKALLLAKGGNVLRLIFL